MQTFFVAIVAFALVPQTAPASEPDGCRDPLRFGEIQQAAKAEFEAAYAAADRDNARAAVGLDAVVARYDPCWNSFADHQARQFEQKVQAAPKGERAAMRERAQGWLNSMRTGHKEWREQIVRNGTLVSPAPPNPAKR